MTQDARAKELRDKALAAIRGEKRIGPHFKPVHFDIDADGTATIEAEVDNVAIKRLALQRLAQTKGVRRHCRPFARQACQGDER